MIYWLVLAGMESGLFDRNFPILVDPAANDLQLTDDTIYVHLLNQTTFIGDGSKYVREFSYGT